MKGYSVKRASNNRSWRSFTVLLYLVAVAAVWGNVGFLSWKGFVSAVIASALFVVVISVVSRSFGGEITYYIEDAGLSIKQGVIKWRIKFKDTRSFAVMPRDKANRYSKDYPKGMFTIVRTSGRAVHMPLPSADKEAFIKEMTDKTQNTENKEENKEDLFGN